MHAMERRRTGRGRGVGRGSRMGRGCVLAAVAGFLLVGAGCDVTNPGPVQDEFLGLADSHSGLVKGSERRLAQAIKNLGYASALAAREIMPGGQTGNHGHSPLAQAGHFEDGSFGGHFNLAQQARFIAEEGLRRFDSPDAEPATPENRAGAHLWAGYAYRVLGENYCEAVVDGGPLEPGRLYHELGEQHFTQALEIANAQGLTTIRNAALAGRAQMRMWLEDWTGAASDARQVPEAFQFFVTLDDGDPLTRNRIYFASVGAPYAAFTMWSTYYEDYYLETRDPRVAWTEGPFEFANASLQGFGQVPYTVQLKYTSGSDDIRLSSGREMRLIEAEALLESGDWEGAMELVNHVRTTTDSPSPLEPWPANSLEEAGTRLKRERAIELFLEGRTMGDHRRWQANGTPGDLELPDFESLSQLFRDNPRHLCFDIPDSERERNPNVPIESNPRPTG